jgi:hypothetical protein
MNESGRKSVTFIFAGYRKEMDEFVQYNPGLESRIKYRFHFDDYSVDDLVKIVQIKIKASGCVPHLPTGKASDLLPPSIPPSLDTPCLVKIVQIKIKGRQIWIRCERRRRLIWIRRERGACNMDTA